MDHATAFQLGIDLGDNPRATQTEAHTADDLHAGRPATIMPFPSAKVRGGSPEAGAPAPVKAPDTDSGALDHFIAAEDGTVFAGSHLIIDLWGATNLNDIAFIEKTLIKAVEEAGATLLHIHLHPFNPEGVSGVAVLAESHISIHTWPETGYAALDVFMCGEAKPAATIPVLERAFRPERTVVSTLRRGEISD